MDNGQLALHPIRFQLSLVYIMLVLNFNVELLPPTLVPKIQIQWNLAKRGIFCRGGVPDSPLSEVPLYTQNFSETFVL